VRADQRAILREGLDTKSNRRMPAASNVPAGGAGWQTGPGLRFGL